MFIRLCAHLNYAMYQIVIFRRYVRKYIVTYLLIIDLKFIYYRSIHGNFENYICTIISVYVKSKEAGLHRRVKFVSLTTSVTYARFLLIKSWSLVFMFMILILNISSYMKNGKFLHLLKWWVYSSSMLFRSKPYS